MTAQCQHTQTTEREGDTCQNAASVESKTMIHTLHQLYGQLPHPILSTLLYFVLSCAAIVGIWEAIQHKRLRKKLAYQASLSQFKEVDTLLDAPIWNVSTVKLPSIPTPSKNVPKLSKVLMCLVFLGFGLFLGIGIEQQILTGQDNSFRVCTQGTCTMMYHETCSDWWQNLQNAAKP